MTSFSFLVNLNRFAGLTLFFPSFRSGTSQEVGDIDDSICVMVIKQGIYKYNATDGDKQSGLYKELLEHAIFEYTNVWLALAKEEDYDFIMAAEKKLPMIHS